MWLGSGLGPGWVPEVGVCCSQESWVSTHSSAWGLMARIHWGFLSLQAGRALPRFHQQGAVCALHQKSAGPRPARQVSWNQAPQTDPSFRNAQVSWYETTLPSFLGSAPPRPVTGTWKAGEGRGMGEGTGGGQGQHHTFPQVSVSGGRGTLRCGRGTSSQYRLAPSSQTLQPHWAPCTPRPALCLHLLSPLRHPVRGHPPPPGPTAR